MKNSTIRSLLTLCLVIFTCFGLTGQQTYQYPFQDPQLPVEERAFDLVSRMTIEEG